MKNLHIFSISYSRYDGTENADMRVESSAIEVGDGLKDVLLYLRNAHDGLFNQRLYAERELTIDVNSAKEKNDYRTLSEEELMKQMTDVRQLMHRLEMRNLLPYWMLSYSYSDVNMVVGKVINSISSTGIAYTLKNEKRSLDYIYNSVIPYIMPQSEVVFQQSGCTREEVERIMAQIYMRIPLSEKERFLYTLDFKNMVYDMQPTDY